MNLEKEENLEKIVWKIVKNGIESGREDVENELGRGVKRVLVESERGYDKIMETLKECMEVRGREGRDFLEFVEQVKKRTEDGPK